MPVYKDQKRGTWYVRVCYTTWQGEKKERKKRGFATKREAVAWEENFLDQVGGTADMMFTSLVDLYLSDMEKRLKESTMDSKRNIIKNHVLPYFEKRKVCEITAPDIRKWQNELTAKSGFSQTYLKSINNQLSAIMNYACRFYRLPENPVRIAGTMGHAHTDDEMQIWTRNQFEHFISFVDEPSYRLLYLILFWTGIRVGEAMVLLPSDVVEVVGENKAPKRILRISKTYYRKNAHTFYNTPKTRASRRDVTLPDFLWDEIWSYMNRLYEWSPNDRIFWFEKNAVNKHFLRACRKADMKPIRIHDLRHSHASMLIDMGKPILEISRRLGHKTVQTTWDTYAHLYPDKDISLAASLNEYQKAEPRTAEQKQADAQNALKDLSQQELATLLAKFLTGN